MQFRILGPLQVLAGGRPLEPGAPKQRALLAYLLIHANQVVQPDRILEELWPERQPDGGVKTLQVHVSKLRKALSAGGRNVLRTDGSGYVLEIGPNDLDAARFERLWRRARSDLDTNPARAAADLQRAEGLWRGPPLADFTYEPFAQSEIRRLEELRLGCIEDRIEADLALGRQAEVLDRLEALITEHPLRERLRGQLMVALYRLGRQVDALRSFTDLRRLLGEELGIEPSPALFDLEDRILLHDTGLAAQPVPAEAVDRLPVRLTSFVGRWRHKGRVRALLAEHRLVTITGVGGVGKSSLAVEVARDAVPEHPDGVWMADLAPLDDGRLVEAEIAGALGVGRRPDVPVVETLVGYLRDRRGLLLLDNCEHLIDGVAGLADRLLRECPDLLILATSRRELGIDGEAPLLLQPLAFPDVGAGFADVAGSPAVQLLVERAQLKRPGFALTESNAGAVAVVCRRVAGIPLALELAAARLQSMSPAEMAGRMDDQFDLLTAGSRAGEPRQRTLEATMDWSYRLLAADERALLRRSAPFRGGFQLDAAEAVTTDIVVPLRKVADLLGRLVEASLMSAESSAGKTVYSMLEPVRQYGLRLLEDSGESDEIRRRHAGFFSDRAALLPGHFHAGRWTELMQQGKEISDDCREALNWALEAGQGDKALQLAASLGPFWAVAGATVEGFAAINTALAAAPARPTDDRILALDHCARFAIGIGEPADPWLDELDEWAEKLGTDEVFGRASGTRGLLAFARGDLNSALGLLADAYERDRRAESGQVRGVLLAECYIRVGQLDEAEQILTELDKLESGRDEYGNHWITVAQGMLAFCRGDLAAAEHHLERAVAEFGRQRSGSGQMESMMYLGWVALDLGKERRARMLAERSLALARREADVLYEATNLWLLARLALRRGELAEARARLEACTDVARRRRESVSLALALFVWADLAAHEGKPERSAGLFGAARQALAAIPHIMPPSIGRGYDETIEKLCSAIGEDSVESLMAAGAEISPANAVEFALATDANTVLA